MTDNFEDKYLDVLQNIETGLVHAYRTNAEMTDYDADRAVEALIRTYQAEVSGRDAPSVRLNLISRAAFDDVKIITDFRLGRRSLNSTDKKVTQVKSVVTLPEIISCLKRVLRSIRTWNQQGGRRGYFTFVEQFFP